MGIDKLQELNEARIPQIEKVKEIKPSGDIKPMDAKAFWDNEVKGNWNLEKTSEVPQDNPRYIITKNESLENDIHPITGVPFERKIVTLPDGERIEVVFPKFESTFDAKIQPELYLSSDKYQFIECNKQLLSKIESDKSFRAKFTDEQIEQIRDGTQDGTAPDGFVWHHNEESGVLQLVDSVIHEKTGHTGGRSLWGGGSDYR